MVTIGHFFSPLDLTVFGNAPVVYGDQVHSLHVVN